MIVYGLRVSTITVGNCYGDVRLEKRQNPVTGEWEMRINTTIPEEFGGGDCTVSGELGEV